MSDSSYVAMWQSCYEYISWSLGRAQRDGTLYTGDTSAVAHTSRQAVAPSQNHRDRVTVTVRSRRCGQMTSSLREALNGT